jgi:hypothetical protein
MAAAETAAPVGPPLRITPSTGILLWITGGPFPGRHAKNVESLTKLDKTTRPKGLRCIDEIEAGHRACHYMKANKHRIPLPIGRTLSLACQIEEMRVDCCAAAEKLMRQKRLDEAELDECACLDDALAAAQRLFKSTVAKITLARLKRRIRAG